MPLRKPPRACLARCALFCLTLASPVSLPLDLRAHDTFFRVASHEVSPEDEVEVSVFHGTFDESVMRLDADHVERLFLVGPHGETELGTASWEQRPFDSRIGGLRESLRATLGGIDRRLTSRFRVAVPQEGTFVVGMSLHPAGAAMNPEVFAAYLAEQGLQDEPVARLAPTDPHAIITERWRKYVKLVLQSGATRTDEVLRPLGLFVEFVPLAHPGSIGPGDELPLRLLRDGRPLPDQVVIVGRAKPAFRDPPPHLRLRSDAEGRVVVPIDDEGVWWLGFVSITPAPEGDEVDWESHWATLTFSIP
ncbi:hypothetical protein ASA1KI_28600 [Opitutales bacterium ASA1]|uniref:DUF4198 domain-containing protein n=1 Tax=Congregicoccus parvus TaxID=3081749 RepID=UPI002B302B74|nr:hypothetical protein ASA1KI_28600 [Opitutales bacterium ASA1]